MDVVFTKAARRAFRRMPTKDRAALLDKIERFAKAGVGDVRKLVGFQLFRLRHGDWRAILSIEDSVVVVRIAHRRDVYRQGS